MASGNIHSPFHRPSFSLHERPSSAGRSPAGNHNHTLSQHTNPIYATNSRPPKSSFGLSSGSSSGSRPSTSSGILQNVASLVGPASGSSGSQGNMKDNNGVVLAEPPVVREITNTPPKLNGKPAPFPYPFSKDFRLTGMDVLDHLFLMQCRKTVTWLDFGTSPPKRSLDLGCGTGAWVIDAAKQWKDCHFVGFDIKEIQPKRDILPRQLAERIEWVRGNFLERLPFDDNSFDHIHVFRVAWGVPEAKWDELFAEVERILKPGGALEWVEEDLVFPRMPRSYTTKSSQRSVQRPQSANEIPPTPVDETASLPHAHALLEALFFGVFESRMINPRPSAILPHYLNTYFRHLVASNEQAYPFPPPPVPHRFHTTKSPSPLNQFILTQSQHGFQDFDNQSTPTSPDMSIIRPRSQSESSQLSQMSQLSNLSVSTTTTGSTTLASSSSSQILFEETEASSADPIPLPPQPPFAPTFGVFHPVSGGNSLSIPLLRPIGPVEINTKHLALHLNTSYARVLACKDAMWAELVRRLRRGREERQRLRTLGWDEEVDDDASAYEDGFLGGSIGADLGIAGSAGLGPGDISEAENDGTDVTTNGVSSDQQAYPIQHGSASPHPPPPTPLLPVSQAIPQRPSGSLTRARARFEEFLARFERDMRLRTGLGEVVQHGLKWNKPRSFGPVNKHERAREIEMEGLVADAARAEVQARLRAMMRRGSDAGENGRDDGGLGGEENGGTTWGISRRFRGFVGIKDQSIAVFAKR